MIPIYVGDEHNEAYYHWHQARAAGHLTAPLDVVHVDAHTDLGMAAELGASVYPPAGLTAEQVDAYVRDLAFNHLDFANWMRPAVLTGLIRNVFVVFPRWRRQTKRKRTYTSVASAFGEGRVLKHGLVASEATALAFPDLKRFRHEYAQPHELPRNRRMILDIDLDFFACRDSIKNELSFELEITREQFGDRERFLANRSLPFMHLSVTFEERDGRCFARVVPQKEPDRSYLPAVTDIDAEVAWLFGQLRERIAPPALVTVCRSCFSGCCPREYVQAVETRVMAALKDWLG